MLWFIRSLILSISISFSSSCSSLSPPSEYAFSLSISLFLLVLSADAWRVWNGLFFFWIFSGSFSLSINSFILFLSIPFDCSVSLVSLESSLLIIIRTFPNSFLIFLVWFIPICYSIWNYWSIEALFSIISLIDNKSEDILFISLKFIIFSLFSL